MEQPKNLEELDKLIQHRQRGSKYSSKLLITFIVLVIVLFIAVILFFYIFKPEEFLKKPQDFVKLFLAMNIFLLVYVGSGVLLLNSKLLSEKDKKILKGFLFVVSPELGWGGLPVKGWRLILLISLIWLGIGAIILFLSWIF